MPPAQHLGGSQAVEAAPAFILGAAGDGGDGAANRLGALLDAHPRLSVVPPSNLLVDLMRAIDANGEALVRYGLPDQYWRKRLAEFFDGLQQEHAWREGKARWVAVLSAGCAPVDELERAFPTARFIRVIRRRSLSCLRSYRGTPAARQNARRYLDVDAFELATHPQACLSAVLGFLGEAADEPETLVVDLAGLEPTTRLPERLR